MQVQETSPQTWPAAGLGWKQTPATGQPSLRSLASFPRQKKHADRCCLPSGAPRQACPRGWGIPSPSYGGCEPPGADSGWLPAGADPATGSGEGEGLQGGSCTTAQRTRARPPGKSGAGARPTSGGSCPLGPPMPPAVTSAGPTPALARWFAPLAACPRSRAVPLAGGGGGAGSGRQSHVTAWELAPPTFPGPLCASVLFPPAARLHGLLRVHPRGIKPLCLTHVPVPPPPPLPSFNAV